MTTTGGDASERVQAPIDNWSAAEILSGVMSPLTALERRLSTPKPGLVERVIAIVAGRRLFRIGSRVAEQDDTESRRLTYANRAQEVLETTVRTVVV